MLHTLNVAQTGLKAAQTQVENVMNNISNENVEGYKRRAVNISEIEHADSRITGRGVFIDSVSRATDVYMYQKLITEEARYNELKSLNSILGDVESIFKETDDAGVSAELNRYFESIENLRTTPSSEVYKNDIINTANSLVLGLKNLYEDIEKQESLLLTETKDVVQKVNSILNEIGNVSKKILDSTGKSEPNDLLDKRDALEKELAQYVDVEISREYSYELKVAGVVAIRFDTNVRQIKLAENYIPQQDAYIRADQYGTPSINATTNDYDSSFTVPFGTSTVQEVQTLDINGTVDTSGEVIFLGTTLTGLAGANGAAVATDIAANDAAIISNWNNNHPDREIDTIAVAGNQVTITYLPTEGDVPAIANSESNGIDFTGSIEATKGVSESLTYVLNNTHKISVTVGEIIYKADGVTPVDFDNSGAPIGEVTEDNIIQALVYRINQDDDIGSVITAYNGKYELDSRGNKVLSSAPNHSQYIAPGTNVAGLDDRYLFIEANVDGEAGSFVGELLINDGSTTPNANTRTYVERTEAFSKNGIDDIHLEIYEKEVDVISGELKPMIDNLKTDSGANFLKKYKERLDYFAQRLSDLTDSYIENSDQTYIFGTDAVSVDYDADKAVNINLFSGASVKTLQFHQNAINTMTQEKLDYLAELQWKEDVNFDRTGENNQSFSQYFQTLRVHIADDRETVIFNESAQEAVKEAIQNNYDQLTKVDKDEEMVNLIKFQSAYEANAKIITTVDEMLQTLLSIKK
jgi:flagellar hook-associated protein 1